MYQLEPFSRDLHLLPTSWFPVPGSRVAQESHPQCVVILAVAFTKGVVVIMILKVAASAHKTLHHVREALGMHLHDGILSYFNNAVLVLWWYLRMSW